MKRVDEVPCPRCSDYVAADEEFCPECGFLYPGRVPSRDELHARWRELANASDRRQRIRRRLRRERGEAA